MKFVKVKNNAFETMQFEAGLLLKTFDPTGVTPVADTDILSATTGGMTISCVPSTVDLGEDVDNAPAFTKEMAAIESWETTLEATLLEVSPETIKMSLGAADIDTVSGKITPRANVQLSDFVSLWWVGDLKGGGMVAVNILNAMSTDGFKLTTTKKGAGQLALKLTGFATTENTELVPMEFYVAEPEATPEG